MLNCQRGLIKISHEAYRAYSDQVKEIFQHLRPTHIEFVHWDNYTWHIYGLSEQFDKLKEAEKAPHYNIKYTDKGLKFKRAN